VHPNKNRLLLILLICLCCRLTSAQSYSYKHYTIFDGLVQNQVTALFHDDKGFIWVGTKSGVSRFDGVAFKNYTYKDGICKGMVVGFFEDNENKLYCMTSNGYSVLINGKFRIVDTFREAGTFDVHGPFSAGNKSFFLVSIANKLYKCNSRGRSYYKTVGKYESIMGYFIDKDKNEYISTPTDFYKINDDGSLQNICNLRVSDLYNYANGDYVIAKNILVSNDMKASLFFLGHGQVRRKFDQEAKYFANWSCRIDDDKIMLLRSDEEWVIIDTSGRELSHDRNEEFVSIADLMQDREGNIWLGTEAGLFRLQSFAFQNYTEDIGLDKYVWSIIEAADSSIWFATYNGVILRYDHGIIKHMTGYEQFVSDNNRFYMGGIRTSAGHMLFPDNEGIIIDYYKGKFSRYFDKKLPGLSTTLCIYEDTASRLLYFGTYGLFVYNEKSGENQYLPLNQVIIKCISKDKFNRVWLCTAKKILLFDGHKIISFGKNEMKFNSGATSCEKDSRGNMWLGSDEGLYVYSYQKITKLFDVPFFFTKMYKDSFMLAGTITGFYYIDLNKYYSGKKSYYKFFDRFNGFTGIECGQNGTCIDAEGNIWIPTSESVVKFMPGKLAENIREPRTYIYNVAVAGKNLQWETVLNEYNFADTLIMFSHNQNNLRISYQGISLSCPEKVMYRTRILGYEEKWSNVTDFKRSTFTNLDPGRYTFEVIACNADGVWNTEPAKLTFEIIPAYWQTWWFRLIAISLAIILITVIIYLIFRYRRNKELERREIEKEIASMQVNTINAQLDPHFIFNAITAIGTEVQENNTEKAYAYFVKVSNLLRSSLTGHEKISRSLGKEIEFVTNYLVLQKYRFGERFEYNISTGPDIDLSFEVPKMCIQIFVENAIKHGLEQIRSGGVLDISITATGNVLQAVIADNGIGRKRSAQIKGNSTGIGLQAFKKFFEILNRFNTNKAGFEIEDLYKESGEAAGTHVVVRIPLDYKLTF
jgi:hypothetical protein